MTAGHPESDLKYQRNTFESDFSSISALTIQICSCPCPHPSISKSISLFIQVSSFFRLFIPFPLQPTQIDVSYPPLFVSLTYFPSSNFLLLTHFISLSASLSLHPSFLCALLFSVSPVLCLPQSLHFLYLPPIPFFPLLCTLSFCLSVTFSPPFLPFSPFSILSFLSFLLASSLSLFSFSEMYYCHLVFKKGTTATLSLINGTGKPTPTLFYSSSSPLHQQ